MKKLYFKNISTSYIQMGVAILLPLIITPYILNGLGQEQYGLWILITSVTAYFGLSSLGFTSTLLKESSSNIDNPEYLSKLVSVVFFSFIGFSLIALVIFIIIYLNLEQIFTINVEMIEISKQTFMITFCIFIISFFTSIFDTLLFAANRLYIKNIVDIIKNILISSSNFLIVFLGYGIFEIALISLLITSIYTLVVVRISKEGMVFYISWAYFEIDLFKQMLRPSIHYFIISIGVLVVFYSDNIIIASFIGLSSVAIYSLGYKVVDSFQLIIFKIVDVLLPNIAVLNVEKKYTELIKLHNKIMLISMSISTPIFLFLYFTNQWILTLWLGTNNVLSKDIMTVFIIFSYMHIWVHVSSVFVAAIGIHKEIAYIGIIEIILNILFSIVFLKIWGLLGVALGTLLSHSLVSGWFVTYWFYKNVNEFIRLNNKEGVNDFR